MSAVQPSDLMDMLKAAMAMMTGRIPMLLAYLVAIIIVIVRWRQAPRASMLALCGVLFGLFLLVLVPILYVWIPREMASGGADSIKDRAMIFNVLGLATSFANAVAFGFLFLAIYADRNRYASPPPP